MSTPQQSFTIRSATEADAENIVALINAAFRLVESFFVEGNRITLKEVLEHLQAGEFLLAEDNNRLIACVYLEPRGERTYLGLLSVDPTLQKGGIGSWLMTAAEDRWRERNAKYIDIHCQSSRGVARVLRQARLYQNRNFTIPIRRKNQIARTLRSYDQTPGFLNSSRRTIPRQFTTME